MIERSEARGKFFYLLLDPDGEKIDGRFRRAAGRRRRRRARWWTFTFAYDAPTSVDGADRPPDGGRADLAAVGGRGADGRLRRRRLGEMNRRISDVVWRSAAVGFVLSLIGGVVISRSAAQRAEQLARTTEDVMGGDLSRRAPVLGSGDEFDRLSEQLNAMLAKLERLVISSRSAGDSIAHDLRSPLTRLRNRLEAGLRDTNSDGPRAALARSIEDVDGVLDTFNAILRLSRVQAGASGSFKRTNVAGHHGRAGGTLPAGVRGKAAVFPVRARRRPVRAGRPRPDRAGDVEPDGQCGEVHAQRRVDPAEGATRR